MTTPAGTLTRQKLVDAATRAFAADGVEHASLLEVARQAGQRNRGAVHYHFGSREGLLVAVLSPCTEALRERHRAALDDVSPDDDLTTVLSALVRPVVALADEGWRGRCYLVVVDGLTDRDPATLDPRVGEILDEVGGGSRHAELGARLPELPAPVLAHRLALGSSFLLRSYAARARAVERGGTAGWPSERFSDDLVAMTAGMLRAPVA